jgi:capsular polysaccharide transport system permease protein
MNPALQSSQTPREIMRSLLVMVRVIFALVIREARVRHGRARIGYAWAIIEPVLLISILTIIFTEFRAVNAKGDNFALFFATGVLAFQAFRNTSVYICTAFEQNKPLFNYPMVKPIHAAFARFVLDSATNLLVMFLVFTFQILALDAMAPNDIPAMMLAIGLMLLLALGAGTCLAVLRRFWSSVFNLYLVIMGPAFFLSCVFFSLESVPTMYRQILAWNPLVHGVEGFRAGYYPEYAAQDVSLFYLFAWVVCLNFLGLVGEWLTRFQDQ